jgi:hypothetical protein
VLCQVPRPPWSGRHLARSLVQVYGVQGVGTGHAGGLLEAQSTQEPVRGMLLDLPYRP